MCALVRTKILRLGTLGAPPQQYLQILLRENLGQESYRRDGYAKDHEDRVDDADCENAFLATIILCVGSLRSGVC